jgi:hypothetical protein
MKLRNNMFKDKKAGEKLLTIWWFFVLVIVGGAIVIGVLIYYSGEIDIRKLEAELLSDRILVCLSEQGELNEKFLEDDFDIFQKCMLDREIIEYSGDFYINISLYDSKGEGIKEITKGVGSFEVNCKLEGEDYPKCHEKEVFVFDSLGEKLKFKILTGTNQEIKKVSVVG